MARFPAKANNANLFFAVAYYQTHAYIHREKSGVDSFVFDRSVIREIMV